MPTTAAVATQPEPSRRNSADPSVVRGGGHASRPAGASPLREDTMTSRRFTTLIGAVALVALAACSSTGGSGTRGSSSYASPMGEPDAAVVLLPTVGAAEQMRAGCWASFYEQPNFNG